MVEERRIGSGLNSHEGRIDTGRFWFYLCSATLFSVAFFKSIFILK